MYPGRKGAGFPENLGIQATGRPAEITSLIYSALFLTYKAGNRAEQITIMENEKECPHCKELFIQGFSGQTECEACFRLRLIEEAKDKVIAENGGEDKLTNE